VVEEEENEKRNKIVYLDSSIVLFFFLFFNIRKLRANKKNSKISPYIHLNKCIYVIKKKKRKRHTYVYFKQLAKHMQ
jgi:hypothetical protein